MKKTRTEQIGARTGKFSRTAIANKDPDFDYCFKRKSDIESGVINQEGWEVAKDEAWQNPFQKEAKTKGKANLNLHDTVLCKRSKEASKYFDEQINQKKRAQIRLIKKVAKDARSTLRATGYDIKINDQTKFSQKIGPNMEADVGES